MFRDEANREIKKVEDRELRSLMASGDLTRTLHNRIAELEASDMRTRMEIVARPGHTKTICLAIDKEAVILTQGVHLDRVAIEFRRGEEREVDRNLSRIAAAHPSMTAVIDSRGGKEGPSCSFIYEGEYVYLPADEEGYPVISVLEPIDASRSVCVSDEEAVAINQRLALNDWAREMI